MQHSQRLPEAAKTAPSYAAVPCIGARELESVLYRASHNQQKQAMCEQQQTLCVVSPNPDEAASTTIQ